MFGNESSVQISRLIIRLDEDSAWYQIAARWLAIFLVALRVLLAFSMFRTMLSNAPNGPWWQVTFIVDPPWGWLAIGLFVATSYLPTALGNMLGYGVAASFSIIGIFWHFYWPQAIARAVAKFQGKISSGA